MKILLLILSMSWALLPARWNAPGGFKISENQVTLQFPQAVKFHVTATSGAKITRVTLIYGTEGPSCQPGGARQALEFTPAADVNLDWVMELKRTGIFPPGANLWWQWELADESGATLTSDRQNVVVNDPRHVWNKLEQHGVILQWYVGDQAFGQKMMNAIAAHLDRLSATMGLRTANPIWITVYPSVNEMKEVLLHTYEWTGAVAFPSYNSILLPASPAETGTWAVDTLAHEMTHLLVEDLIFNCQGVNQPTWLSEGLAMNGEGKVAPEDRQSVLAALKAGSLPPLRSLERGFSGDPTAARLSYAQSATVVEYLLQKGGAQKLGELLAAMKSGLLVDEALKKVYTVDTAGLDGEWRTSLGFAPAPSATAAPAAKTATAIPTIALWTSVARASATLSATLTPPPTPTQAPPPSATPPARTATATLEPTPTPKTGPSLPFCPSSLAFPPVFGAVWFINRRRRLHDPL